MYRVPKAEAVRLFKYVTAVDIKFHPWDSKATVAKELWRRLSSPALVKSNPKAAITIKALDTPAPPALSVKYVDGSDMHLEDMSTLNVVDAMSHIHMAAAAIDNVWVMEGKELDHD
uniref:Large ribosomal subunit protein mL53 n=1 Tax=Rhizochromulina marina TaxID=1034831 RepID=A0A7S2WQL9_9STRA|mmetsp:Transcript_30412/g.88448  ORF Transcript_30412/g.88448 Transcript_30412/m.88448 type:complete len:116 (+) Transcript_30412:81-428(+)